VRKEAKHTSIIDTSATTENAIFGPSNNSGSDSTHLQRSEVYSTAFHSVMNIIGADLKDDLIVRLKNRGLQFDAQGNPQMSLTELESGLRDLLGGGATLIIRYIQAEIQMLE